MIVEAYNQIVTENEQRDFVDDIARSSGFPIWKNAFVYSNKTSGENLILVPLAFVNQKK